VRFARCPFEALLVRMAALRCFTVAIRQWPSDYRTYSAQVCALRWARACRFLLHGLLRAWHFAVSIAGQPLPIHPARMRKCQIGALN
jgi:hypothetical protein